MTVEADPTVEKTLGTVLCSSRDGVPLKLKKEMADQAVLKYLSIDTTFDPCYLSLDSTFKLFPEKVSDFYSAAILFST